MSKEVKISIEGKMVNKLTADDYIDILEHESFKTFSFDDTTVRDFTIWQNTFRNSFKSLLGIDKIKDFGIADLKPEIIESTDCDGYVKETVTINTEQDFEISFYLVMPKNISFPAPAIITLHDEEFNNDKIAIMGNSKSGAVAMYTAACDLRISSVVVSNYFGSFYELLNDGSRCGCEYIPGILNFADLPDIAGLISPRQLLIISDEKTHFEKGYEPVERLKKIYKTASASSQIKIVLQKDAEWFSLINLIFVNISQNTLLVLST